MEKTKKRAISEKAAPRAATVAPGGARGGGGGREAGAGLKHAKLTVSTRRQADLRPHPKNPRAYDSIAQAAKMMGVPRSVLQKLKRAGAPGFHGSRVYPGELRPHLEAAQKDKPPDAPLDRETLENRRLLAQCERIERDNLAAAGKVIALAPVLTAIAGIGEQLKGQLRAIYEDELPPVIAGLSAEAIRIETRKANDRLCAKFFEGTGKIGGSR